MCSYLFIQKKKKSCGQTLEVSYHICNFLYFFNIKKDELGNQKRYISNLEVGFLTDGVKKIN